MLKRLPVILLVCFAVSACGFHLRGKLPLSDKIKVIAVKSEETTETQLRQRVSEALTFAGATVVPDEATASAVLDLYKVDFKRTVRTIDSRGKATGYTLEYIVRFKVVSADGTALRDARPISIRRDYNFDPNQVLQKEDEERELKDDMEKELSQRILRQLSTIASLQQLQASSRLTVPYHGS